MLLKKISEMNIQDYDYDNLFAGFYLEEVSSTVVTDSMDKFCWSSSIRTLYSYRAP